MMRSFDVHAKTLAPSVRTLLFSIFTPKQKPPSLSLPLHFSSSSHTSSRFFSNATTISNPPMIHGIRNFVSLFIVRAFSSSPAASLQRQHLEEECGGEKLPPLEVVGDGSYGGLEAETKLSLPVRAYFFSTNVDLKSLVEQNKLNFIPPTSRMTNYVVLKFGNHSDPTGSGGCCISGSECIYMVVFQYGSIVLFNVREQEVDEYLKVVERHSSGLLSEMRKDEYEVRENPALHTWMQGGLDYIMLQFLDIDGIRTIGSVLGQSIALDYYGRQVDGMVGEFTDINRGMEKTGTFTMDRKKLFQLVGKANSNLADVILKLGLFERSDIAWKDAKYGQIWEYLRDEFELTQRFASLDFKLKFVEDSFRITSKQEIRFSGVANHYPDQC
ncbi:Protein RETARDED ROOT GROWTH-LIKE [Hirschfeldia incana]|nr:Protein RETARDED ROOT GROWTH-LIKE [Hirschfeldia incana]